MVDGIHEQTCLHDDSLNAFIAWAEVHFSLSILANFLKVRDFSLEHHLESPIATDECLPRPFRPQNLSLLLLTRAMRVSNTFSDYG